MASVTMDTSWLALTPHVVKKAIGKIKLVKPWKRSCSTWVANFGFESVGEKLQQL